MNKIRIAIQSQGRLRAASLEWLQTCGLELPLMNERSLLLTALNQPIEILFVRHSDIPRYVEAGTATYGIVGANVLYEYEPNVLPLQRFSFGDCRLVIAAPEQANITTLSDLSGKRIATSYPNSLRKFLRSQRIPATVVEMNGSVELAPQLNLAEAICDLTQTGTTLQLHGLMPLHTILESQATLIMTHFYQPMTPDIIYSEVSKAKI